MAHDFQVLPAAAGYGIVIGIGGIFALFMIGLTWLQNRYTSFSTHQAEEFNTASRSVKPGLISAGIVSSWTWSATLLTSSTFAYSYGVCGPMWYGAAGTLQILLFSLVAVKIKANAPGAHTMPEIVLVRHGKIAHLTYLYNGLATNMLVGACLILGGAQVVAALTGMNAYAAIFLIPAVVAAYVIAGGLRSTFIADYTHTVILFIAILVFGFLVSATSDLIGSPGRLYELLQEASERMPIDRNTNGSYLAFHSVGGLIFAVDILVSGFTMVWLDQAYWQRAIASRPETSVKAYMLGGIAWYGENSIRLCDRNGTRLCRLDRQPGFSHVSPSFCPPNKSMPGYRPQPQQLHCWEKVALFSCPILLFMAVTSATSAELIAVSSLLTFDVYKTYIRPHTDSATLVRVSHWGIVLYAVVLAAFCCVLNAVGLSLTWLLTVLGVIVGGAAVPVGLILLWDRMSTVAAIAAPWIGFTCGIVVWFVTSWKRSGGINVETTGDETNAVAGNLASLGVGVIAAILLSFAFPGNRSLGNKSLGGPASTVLGVSVEGKDTTDCSATGTEGKDVEATVTPASPHPTGLSDMDRSSSNNAETQGAQVEPMDPVVARKAERFAWTANVIFILCAVILVPFTLFGTQYVYTREFFTGWVVVSFIWIWMSVIICVIYPVIESAGALRDIARGLWRDIRALGG